MVLCANTRRLLLSVPLGSGGGGGLGDLFLCAALRGPSDSVCRGTLPRCSLCDGGKIITDGDCGAAGGL